MKKKLKKSLIRDESYFNLIIKNNPKTIIRNFIFSVRISKTKYLQMIKDRYISTLLNFSDKQISDGLIEIRNKYKKELKFKDRLICLIIKNN